MTIAVNGIFDGHNEAAEAVYEIKRAGIRADDIGVIASKDDGQGRHGTDRTTAGKGAFIGGAVGGGAGLLAGLAAIAIPGFGPLLGAGWLAMTAAGAAVGATGGGLLGALTQAGADTGEAENYVEGIRRGGTLVSVRVPDDGNVSTVQAIMAKYSGTYAHRIKTGDWADRMTQTRTATRHSGTAGRPQG